MTREKVLKVVKKVIERKQGLDPETVATAIVDAIELIQEAESGEPQVIDFDAVTAPLRPQAAEKPRTFQPPPPPTTGAVLPVDRARAATPDVTVLRPSKSPQEAAPVYEEEKWDIGDLSAQIHRATPAKLSLDIIDPEGHHVTIDLVRNVLCAPELKAVKLSYKYPSMDDSLESSESFFTTQEDIDVDGALDKIREKAKGLYRPRPRNLVSTTPFMESPMFGKGTNGEVVVRSDMGAPKAKQSF